MVKSASMRRCFPAVLFLWPLLWGCPQEQENLVTDASTADNQDVSATQNENNLLEPPPATRTQVEAAIQSLTRSIKEGVTDPTNAWTMAHGIVAFGKRLKLSDGSLAIDTVVTDFVQARKENGQTRYFFPEAAPDKTPVEPHPDLILKTLLGAGVSPDRKFVLKDKSTLTLRRLIEDAAHRFKLPQKEDDWRKFAWSFLAFLEDSEQHTLNTKAQKIKLSSAYEAATQELSRAQSFLTKLRQQDAPDKVTKRKQGIYAHTCGGIHFVQSIIRAAAKNRTAEDRKRVDDQLKMLLFRYDAERRIYLEALQTNPKLALIIVIQQLKFFGHVLETFGLAHVWGVLETNPSQVTKVRQVTQDLLLSIQALQKVYADQQRLKAEIPQSYYDLIGDGAHALNGLKLSLVPFFSDT